MNATVDARGVNPIGIDNPRLVDLQLAPYIIQLSLVLRKLRRWSRAPSWWGPLATLITRRGASLGVPGGASLCTLCLSSTVGGCGLAAPVTNVDIIVASRLRS